MEPGNCRHLFRANLLLWVVPLFMAGGVAAGRVDLPIPRNLLVLSALTLVLLAAILETGGRRGTVLLLPIFFLAGFIRTGQALVPVTGPADIAGLVSTRTELTLGGTLAGMVEFDGRISRFELVLDSVLFHDHGEVPARFRPAHGRVRLTMRAPFDPAILPGARLLVIASVDRIRNYRTPGVFDYRLSMAARSIRCSGLVRSPLHIMAVRDPDAGLLHRIRYLPERIRTRINTFLASHLEPETAGLYQALLIGSRSAIAPGILEQFKATGTMHLLAISGMHMGLLGLMIGMILTWLMQRSTWLLLHIHVPTVALLLSLPPLLGYGLVAGMNLPVLRALVMATLFLVAVLLRRQSSLPHLLAAAALFLLAIHPLALFTVSFQLSFAAVLAIALVFPRLHDLVPPGGKPGTAMVRPARVLLAGFLVSLAATMGTLPFMLYHFNRFSPLGPVMNLLVEPLLCFWALPLGLIAVPLIFVAPAAAAMLLNIGGLAIQATAHLTALAAGLPFATIWTITPSWLEAGGYFLFLACWFGGRKSTFLRPVALAGLAVLALEFTSGLWLPRHPATSRVVYLDVGQGSATLLQIRGGRTILIDGGSRTSPRFNAGERIIAPFLWKNRLWRIDDLVITHPHADHFNGMATVIRHFAPRRLFINGREKDQEQGYGQLLALARARGVAIIVPSSGQAIAAGEDTGLTCLGTNGLAATTGPMHANDHSLVLLFRHGSCKFLFPGDIEKTGETMLLASGAPIGADILLAPHHGSRTSSSPAFITGVHPGLIVVSAGRSGRGRFPAPVNLSRWRQQGILALVTATAGTVFCRTDGSAITVRDSAGNEWRTSCGSAGWDEK